jgi:1-acyl-sn-glycerol-3-phosphate acyltransferase
MKFFTKPYFILPFLLQATLWRIVMRPFFALFTRFEVHGLENLKGITGPVIFAPNHASELDSVLLPLALPLWSRFAPVFYVVREPKFYSDPYFKWRKYIYGGFIFRILGALPIVSGTKDYSVSLKRHTDLLEEGNSVCIFPEGAISKDGSIGSGHGGVGYLALSTGLPIVPVLIEGTYNLSAFDFFGFRKHAKVFIMNPITFEKKLSEITYDECVKVASTTIEILREKRQSMTTQEQKIAKSQSFKDNYA